MPDFGDEFGANVEQTAQHSIVMYLQGLRHRQKPGDTAPPTRPGEEGVVAIPVDHKDQAIEFAKLLEEHGIPVRINKDPLKPSITIKEEDYTRWEKIIQNYIEKNGDVLISMELDDIDVRNTVMEILEENEIPFDVNETNPLVIKVATEDVKRVNNLLVDNLKHHSFIKSWDSMDSDPTTAQGEHGDGLQHHSESEHAKEQQYSWKGDIESRVAEAREGAATEAEFITRCEERGLVVTNAKDNELMFVHPGHGHWKVRADNIGFDGEYSKKSFDKKEKPVTLAEEAKDAREASKILSEESALDAPARDVPNLQNIAK